MKDSEVGVGPRIVKHHVTHPKFLLAKVLSRQNLVRSAGSELPLWLKRQENALPLTKTNASSTASPLHAGKITFPVFLWPHFFMVGFSGIFSFSLIHQEINFIWFLSIRWFKVSLEELSGSLSYPWRKHLQKGVHFLKTTFQGEDELILSLLIRGQDLMAGSDQRWSLRWLQVDWMNPTVFLDK